LAGNIVGGWGPYLFFSSFKKKHENNSNNAQQKKQNKNSQQGVSESIGFTKNNTTEVFFSPSRKSKKQNGGYNHTHTNMT